MVGSVALLRLQVTLLAFVECIYTMGDGTAPVQRQAGHDVPLLRRCMATQPVRLAESLVRSLPFLQCWNRQADWSG